MENENALVTQNTTAIVEQKQEQFSSALMVTQEYIDRTMESLTLLRKLVDSSLVKGIDYGTVPGISDEFLWDAGANQIIASFNCRPGPVRVIKETNTEDTISVILEMPLISFQTGQEVGCGIGAASTMETKHKYRWLRKYELADWGYHDEAAIKALKTRKKWNDTEYQIINPNRAELLNVVWKMAAKRARIAAAKTLPGVSSALAEKFNEGMDKGQKQKKDNPWGSFYAQMKQRGLSGDRVHALLGVTSLTELIKDGRTPAECVKLVDNALAKEQSPVPDTTTSKPMQPPDTENKTAAMWDDLKRDDQKTPATSVSTPVSKSDEVYLGVNLTDLNTMIADIHWDRNNGASWRSYLKSLKVVNTDGTLGEVIKRVTPEQFKQLASKVNDTYKLK
jgi:hypothetical protein